MVGAKSNPRRRRDGTELTGFGITIAKPVDDDTLKLVERGVTPSRSAAVEAALKMFNAFHRAEIEAYDREHADVTPS